MFRFFLFFRGYYLIAVKGYAAERFINLCRVKNIYLWDLKTSHEEYRMKITIADYNMLEELVNKTGVKVDILGKYGLPFLFLGKKSRIFSLVFIVIAMLLVFVSNQFVWQIRFEGNYTITDEQIVDFLSNYEIKEGVSKSKIEYEILEENLRKQFPIVKWCSVALNGNTLYVHVEENNLFKEETDVSEECVYSDIVATEDGIVKSLMVRNGLSLVKVGDSVTKGQILVTGAVPIYDDSLLVKAYHYYQADADVAIETNYVYEETLEHVYFDKAYTGRSKKTGYLKLGNLDLHFPFNPAFAYYNTYRTSNRLILFNSVNTPVYYGEIEAREYYLTEQKYTKEEVVDIFNEKLRNYYASLDEKGVQILQKDVKIEDNVNNWVLCGNFVVSVHCTENVKRYTAIEFAGQTENTVQ